MELSFHQHNVSPLHEIYARKMSMFQVVTPASIVMLLLVFCSAIFLVISTRITARLLNGGTT